ncbi:accessory gene regulator ArgB-like protein [Bacillus halotolerans]|uniref:accessory gene regulator ArgB-like protein n=1 Tax=Bacillus halotolerans TaxID=260554 RepID=UPI00187A3C79|nr:accessory gene regulator B family protein [Bacillus halotolerans]MEC1543689.1 accessory gene regulator B family protein [Bacillus halotolerans]
MLFNITPHNLSRKISKQIIYFNPELRDLQDSIRYGLEWMLATVNQVFIVIIIAGIFGNSAQALIVLAAGGLFRMISGGSHFKSYNLCLFFSTLQILFITYISIEFEPYFTIWTNWLLKILLAISFLITFKNSPKLQKKNHLFTPTHKMKLKIGSISIFLCLLLISLMGDDQYKYSIWMALIMQSITLTDSWDKILLSFVKRF